MLDTSILVDSSSTPKITLYPQKDTPKEVLWAMQINHPGVAVSDYKPSDIEMIIAPGACAKSWLVLLRNAASPKTARPKRKRNYESKRKSSRSAALAFGRLAAAGATL